MGNSLNAGNSNQKADREKLRRNRLNKQFVELGKALDPDRPKNDKATILTDTIHMLTDLTSQVKKLKTEHSFLLQESRELTEEKNELREEKASLKSEIESLNTEYQKRVGHSYPSYQHPMSVPLSSGPVPMQAFRYFPNQTYNPSAYMPFGFQGFPPQQNITSIRQQISIRQVSSEVVTDLELRTPGSTVPSSRSKDTVQILSSKGSNEKQQLPRRNSSNADEVIGSNRSTSDNFGDASVSHS